MDRIREGCGRFPQWRGPVVAGAMKKLRRHEETLTMVMRLQLRKSSIYDASRDDFQVSFGQHPYTITGDGQVMLPMMSAMSWPSPVNYTRYLLPASSYQDSESAESSFEVSQPVTAAPQGLPKSLNSSADHVGHMSYQLSEQVPCISSSGNPEFLTSLDPSYLSSPDWYPGQSLF